MKLLLILLLFLITQANAGITEGGTGMLFGDDHTFTVTAKDGWVLDNHSGVNRGLHMIFYPKEKTWSNSPVIIYGRISPTNEVPTIALQVEKTVHDFVNHGSTNYKSKKVTSLQLHDGKEAIIYHFSGDKWGNFEAAAYIKEKDTINYLVFNSRKKERKKERKNFLINILMIFMKL